MKISPAEDLWVRACDLIRAKIDWRQFDTWILELNAIDLDRETLTLEAPFGIFKSHVTRKYLTIIEKSVCAVFGEEIHVSILAPESIGGRPLQTTRSLIKSLQKASRKKFRECRDPKKTFKSFSVVGPNRLAYLAVHNLVAEDTVDQVSRVLVCGKGAGLGKTHLLRAVENKLHAQQRASIFYTWPEFVHDVTLAAEEERLPEFRGQFQNCILLLSKIQFPIVSPVVEEELGHVIQTVFGSGSSVIITTDHCAESASSHLQHYFNDFLIVEIEPLDADARGIILTAKLAQLGIVLEKQIIMRLVKGLHGTVREIEGLALHIEDEETHRFEGDLDALSMQEIPTILPFVNSDTDELRMEKIIVFVAFRYGVTVEELTSKNRLRRIVWPRHIAAWCCRYLTGSSLPKIGKVLGKRNHTSILRAVRIIDDQRTANPSLAKELSMLQQSLKASISQQSSQTTS